MTGGPVPWTLAALFPVGDWQFWVVTALFLGAVAWLGRGLLPWGGKRRIKKTRVTLTVGGKAAGTQPGERPGGQ